VIFPSYVVAVTIVWYGMTTKVNCLHRRSKLVYIKLKIIQRSFNSK